MIDTTAERTDAGEHAQVVQAADIRSGSAVAQAVEARSAVIIPFRPRPAPQAAAPSTTPAQQRLVRALETLNTAMADQRSAMAQWRTALAALKTSTTGLGDSLQRYQANLTSLSQGVAALRTQAKSLQGWAERAGATD